MYTSMKSSVFFPCFESSSCTTAVTSEYKWTKWLNTIDSTDCLSVVFVDLKTLVNGAKFSTISICYRDGTFLDINFISAAIFYVYLDPIYYRDSRTFSTLISIHHRRGSFLIFIPVREGTIVCLDINLLPWSDIFYIDINLLPRWNLFFLDINLLPCWNIVYMNLISIYYRNGTFYHDGIFPSLISKFTTVSEIFLYRDILTLLCYRDGTFFTLKSIDYRDQWRRQWCWQLHRTAFCRGVGERKSG